MIQYDPIEPYRKSQYVSNHIGKVGKPYRKILSPSDTIDSKQLKFYPPPIRSDPMKFLFNPSSIRSNSIFYFFITIPGTDHVASVIKIIRIDHIAFVLNKFLFNLKFFFHGYEVLNLLPQRKRKSEYGPDFFYFNH